MFKHFTFSPFVFAFLFIAQTSASFAQNNLYINNDATYDHYTSYTDHVATNIVTNAPCVTIVYNTSVANTEDIRNGTTPNIYLSNNPYPSVKEPSL